MQERVKGKIGIGRTHISWLCKLREWFDCSSTKIFKQAVDKIRMALVISNSRCERNFMPQTVKMKKKSKHHESKNNYSVVEQTFHFGETYLHRLK